jgi:GNAT superfamily N-acetyltransferase
MPLKAEGEFALVRERLENGLLLAGQPVKRGTMAHDHDMYMALTDSAAQQYDNAAIEVYTPRLEELAKRDNHRLYLAVAHRARGIGKRLMGEHEQSQVELKHALELFGELGTRWQSGRTLTELGLLESTRGNLEATREYCKQALEEFEALGAQVDAARVHTILAELD